MEGRRTRQPQARAFSRVALLPFHDTLEDPKQPGRMKDEWTHADGDHPSVEGYRRLGEVAFRLPD